MRTTFHRFLQVLSTVYPSLSLCVCVPTFHLLLAFHSNAMRTGKWLFGWMADWICVHFQTRECHSKWTLLLWSIFVFCLLSSNSLYINIVGLQALSEMSFDSSMFPLQHFTYVVLFDSGIKELYHWGKTISLSYDGFSYITFRILPSEFCHNFSPANSKVVSTRERHNR